MYRVAAAALCIACTLVAGQAAARNLTTTATFKNNSDTTGEATVSTVGGTSGDDIANIPVSRNGGVWTHTMTLVGPIGSGSVESSRHLQITFPGGARCFMVIHIGLSVVQTGGMTAVLPRCSITNSNSVGGASCSFSTDTPDNDSCNASMTVR
jgi:hypothetical protein